MDPRVRRISRGRKLTPEEAAHYCQLREEIEREKPAILEQLKKSTPVGLLIVELRNARMQAGLSLNDIGERTGLDRSYLSRLETGVRENPSLETLNRIAHAVGKRVEVRLVDEPQAAR